MDISRQTYSEANSTSISMYLSFDSSMSSAAYKTMEATNNELSMLSNMDYDEKTVETSTESHQNSTLEALDSHVSYIKAMEKLEPRSPICTLSKRILQEYNAVCSTPSKDQLLRSVEIMRGSHAEHCIDVKEAFLDMDMNKSAKKVMPTKVAEDKENTGSQIAVEQKFLAANVGSVVAEPTKILLSTINEAPSPVADEIVIIDSQLTTNSDTDATPKAHMERPVKVKSDKVSTSAKTKRSSLPKKKPICEPDLQSNRPSRIVNNANKGASLTSAADKEIAETLPKLLNKVLRFANTDDTVMKTNVNGKPNGEIIMKNSIVDKSTMKDNVDGKRNAVAADKRKSIVSMPKGRASMLPATVHAEKRPFAFTQRMSVLVKTTLNSPARKIARRSVAPVGQQTWKPISSAVPQNNNRKSMLPVGKNVPTAVATTNAPAAKSIETKPAVSAAAATSRKSMYTQGKKQTTEAPSRNELGKRRSIYPTEKERLDTQVRKSIMPQNENKTRQTIVAAKPEASFNCSVCGSKFRIKSLLDAHKRTHEEGIPAFVKKPTANMASASTAAASGNTSNKCKYCDKKFALLRALHIHLMQNCPKIPPSEKRKLKFTEMNHVEKAQLPTVFHINNSNSNCNSHSNSLTVPNGAMKAAPPRSHSDMSSVSISSTESASDKRAFAEITMIANQAVAAVDGMAPPPSNIVKKAAAHAGVYRTPNKSITCHVCKQSFKCIMDHIQHNMTVHFKPSNNQKNHNNNAVEQSAE